VKPDLGSESRFLPTPLAFDAPVRGIPLEYCHAVKCEIMDGLGYPAVKKFEDMFIRFDKMYERDRQTHRHRITT